MDSPINFPSDLIVHITERSRWQTAQPTGTYRADSLATAGFIHCSRPAQVLWVAHNFYRGQTGLVLLCIDPDQVLPEIHYDTIATGAQFPHIYGPLNVAAVIQVLDFVPNDRGEFELPEFLL